METNDTYNFYDQSKLVRIDHVDNFNEFIHLAQNQASQDDVCEADFEMVDDEDSDAEEKVKEVAKEEVAKVTAIPKELPGFIKCRMQECWIRIISQILN